MALDLGTLVARLRVDNDMDPGLSRGRRSMDRFVGDASRRLDGLSNRFRRVGRDAGEGVGDGVDEGSRRGLGRFTDRLKAAGDTLGDLAKKGAKGVGELASSMGKLAKENPQLIIGGLVGALGALPLVAGIASSALTVGLGGAMAMVAIKAAASAKSVQDAFGDLQDDLKSGLRDAAAPFEGSLVRMIATARKELGGLAGPAKAAFANLAGPIEKAFGSVARAVGSLGPTLAYISQQAGPLIEVLGRELGILVKGLASDFARLAGAADPRFLTVLVGAFRAVSAVITEVIVRAAQLGSGILDLAGFLGIDWKPASTGAKGLGEAFVATAAGARDASEAIQEINDALAEHFDPSIAVFNATTRIKESFQSLVTALKESKGELNGNSAAAQQARNAFAGALTSVTDLYKATVTKTGSDEKARAAIEKQIPVLYALAGQNQGARNQVDALAKSFGMVPGAVLPAEKSFVKAAQAMGLGIDQAKALYKQLDRRPELKLTITDLQSKLKQAKDSLDKVPKEKRPEIKATITDLQKKLRQAKLELDKLQSKTINVSVQVKQSGTTDALRRLSGYATGGLVKGPGTATSDSIPANLSNGEYVLPASVVKRVGVKKLDALRKGTGFGPVSISGGGGNGTPSFGTVDINGGGTPGTGALSARDQAAIRRHDRNILIKGIQEQVKTLKAGLAKIRDAREELLEGLTSMSSDTVKSTSKGLADMVRDAFKGLRGSTTMDDRLLASISSTSKRLQTLADERTKVAERLQEALAFAAGVTGRAKGDASVLGIEVVDEDGQRVDPTGGELATGLKARLETLRKFSGDIKNLAAQGLSQTILRDLMEAGPAAAGGIAAAIGQGGQGVIQELTQLQNAIDAEAKELGEFSADHLYDAGARAGEGFLTGLTGQLETLEATMENLANNLIAAVTNGIAAAQKIAAEQAEKLKSANEKDKPKPKQEATWGKVDIGGKKPAPGASQNISGGGKLPAPKAAVHIENYHEAAGGNYRRTGEEILLLTKSRG